MELKQLQELLQNTVKEMRENWEEYKKTNDALLLEKDKKLNEKITEIEKQMIEMQKSIAERRTPPVIGNGDSNPEIQLQKKAFEKYIRAGMQSLTIEETKALSSLVDENGGYFVPEDMRNEILRGALELATVRPLARVITTSRDMISTPKLTAKPVAGWTHENVAVDPQNIGLGKEKLPVEELKVLVLVPKNLIEDSATDVAGLLSGLFAETFAEQEDRGFIMGDGVGKPEGIMNNADILANKVDTTEVGKIHGDDFINVFYGLKKAYRSSAVWLMNSMTEAAARKLKDNNGQYLWQPSLQTGSPATILGRPIYNQEDMDGVEIGKYPVCFGALRYYWIADRSGISIQRLVERYAEYGQIGFLGSKRVGGQPVIPEAFKVLKVK